MKILCPLPTLFRIGLWLTALGVVLGVSMTGEPGSAPGPHPGTAGTAEVRGAH